MFLHRLRGKKGRRFGGKKCGACLHVATLPETDWVLIGSVNPTSPGGRRPPLAEPPEAALCPNAQQFANGDPRAESDYGPYQSNSSLPPAESDIS